MEQGLITTPFTTTNNVIGNLNTVSNNTDYVLTRNLQNEVVVEEIESNILNLSIVEENKEYKIIRNNANNIVVTESEERIGDLSNVQSNKEYLLTRNNNNELRVVEAQQRINGLENIENNRNYQITRNNISNGLDGLNNISEDKRYHIVKNNIKEDSSISIPNINYSTETTFGIRNNQLTSISSTKEYVFRTNNLQLFALFNVLGNLSSRCLYVINEPCKITKVGLLHVTNRRTEGLIDRIYQIEFIVNNRNRGRIDINYPGGGILRTVVQDISNLNLSLNSGDCLGLRYSRRGGDNTGNYCEVRATTQCI